MPSIHGQVVAFEHFSLSACLVRIDSLTTPLMTVPESTNPGIRFVNIGKIHEEFHGKSLILCLFLS